MNKHATLNFRRQTIEETLGINAQRFGYNVPTFSTLIVLVETYKIPHRQDNMHLLQMCHEFWVACGITNAQIVISKIKILILSIKHQI